MSCLTISKISFINFYNNFIAAMWLWTNGTFKSSLHSPSKGTYLDFAKNSGRPGHLQSGLLIQGANEKTTVWHTVIYRGFLGNFFPWVHPKCMKNLQWTLFEEASNEKLDILRVKITHFSALKTIFSEEKQTWKHSLSPTRFFLTRSICYRF
jgi:hypothetical protein